MKKRKSFWTVFWWKFFWITVVLVILCVSGLSIFVTISKDDFLNNFHQTENTRRNNITDVPPEELGDFDRRQQFSGATFAESSQVMTILYDPDTREQIAGCEEVFVFLRRKTEETPARVYCYPTADIPGWSEHREKVMELKKGSNVIYETIEMPYFYWNGDKVVPGPFTVTVTVTDLFDFEMADEGYEPKLAFVSSFDVSGEVTGEYEQIDKETPPYDLGPLIVGYSPSNPWLQLYGGVDEAYAILQAEYEKVKNGGEVVSDWEQDTFFTRTMVSFVDVELQDGRTVTLLSAAKCDVWGTWKTVLLIIAALVLIFDIVLALILASISYAQIKARYRMEDYRKNLMNTMAHDLKSPLMSISGYAENLADNTAPGKQEYYAGAIMENVQYMNGIIESVLTLSKTEKVGIGLNREEVDVVTLLEEVVKRFELPMTEKKLQLKVEGQRMLKADRSLMVQVLDNLIGNAVKYAAQDSTIEVLLDNKYMQMSNACEEDLSDVAATLCEPFVVGNKSRSGKTGSGMGLAIVENICTLHGYRLQVSCEKQKFTVKIFV